MKSFGGGGLGATERSVCSSSPPQTPTGSPTPSGRPSRGNNRSCSRPSSSPPPRLVLCGAGHDAIPLVRLGAGLGWRVVVVDDRTPMLSPERFPAAAAFVECQPGDVTEAAAIDDRTYVVVMSHNFLRDKDYLKTLLTSSAAYIGMLGPKARLQRLLDGLRADDVEIPADLDRIHGPAGLDVGGEGPDEIAAAIVGEVLAVSRDRSGGFLRARSGPIHERGAAKV